MEKTFVKNSGMSSNHFIVQSLMKNIMAYGETENVVSVCKIQVIIYYVEIMINYKIFYNYLKTGNSDR